MNYTFCGYSSKGTFICVNEKLNNMCIIYIVIYVGRNKKKMNKKEKIIVIGISILLGMFMCSWFLNGFYSMDTQRINSQGYFNYAINDAYIKDGRLFSAIIFALLGFMSLSIKTVYIINLIISILILSISVLEIYKILNKIKPTDNKKRKILYYLVSSLYIFNFTLTNIVQFIDSFVINMSVLLFIKSLEKSIIDKNRKKGFLYALIAIFCYQGTVPVYIATAFLLCLLIYKKVDKKFLKDFIISMFIMALVGTLNVLFVAIVPHFFGLELTSRVSLSTLIMKVRQNFYDFYNVIFDCYGHFPKYLLLVFCFCILIIIGIYEIKAKKINHVVYILSILLAYMFSIFIMFPIEAQKGIVRILVPVGELFSASYMYLLCNTDIFEKNQFYKKALIFILAVYFIINTCNTFKITKEYKMANIIDQEFVRKVENKIGKEYGKDVDEVNFTVFYRNYENMNYDMNTFDKSLYLNGSCTTYMLKFYMKEKYNLNRQIYDENIILENFGQKSSKQLEMKNIDGVLYIVVDFSNNNILEM